MKIAIGSDHGGYAVKEKVKALLAAESIEVLDYGTDNRDSVDYPDFVSDVCHDVMNGTAMSGILVCTTGIGMTIAANRYPRIRAALCTSPEVVPLCRSHNNANVLSLAGGSISDDDLAHIVKQWLDVRFDPDSRHGRRVEKFDAIAKDAWEPVVLPKSDPEIFDAIEQEGKRQKDNIELIASENYTSRAVQECNGSVLTNKYAEGYPGRRWYHGCDYVDKVEQIAIDRAKELFGAEHANVQAHSGSTANQAVYFAALEPGDRILAMDLAHGGHLTHGMKLNFSGRFFDVVAYGVEKESEQLDYDEIERLALESKPKMLVCGASAYSRIIDFKRLRQIADKVDALLFADIAHIAGLVAAGCHPSPFPHCDYVTTTTHKTLRGPRGGLIMCKEQYAKAIDSQVFPGVQGGPLMHTIAGKAVCFGEALQPEFKTYAQQVVANASALATGVEAAGLRVVSGGSDNHVMLVDLTPIGVTGRDAAEALDHAGITVNKNAIPFDTKSPFVTSGIRLGTAAVTTRGMMEDDMKQIAAWIGIVLREPDNKALIAEIRNQVSEFTAGFLVP